MYLSLYLFSWELLCHRNDFQVADYLRNAIRLIYRPNRVFLNRDFCTVDALYPPYPTPMSVRERHQQRVRLTSRSSLTWT